MCLNEVNEKLSSYELPIIVEQDSKTTKYLLETYKFFQIIESQKAEALKTYKANKFNIKSVAKYLGIERQTIYNYDVVQKFIKVLQSEIASNDIFNQFNTQKQALEEKEAEFQLLYRRDIQIENLKIQVKSLSEQLMAKEIEYNNLEVQYQSGNIKEDVKEGKIINMNKYLEDV